MTRSKKFILPSSVGILLSTLLACSANNEQAGIEGTGDSFTATGTISTFGSIWVNGTRIDTNAAQITLNDVTAIESNLHKGMIVDVSGSIDQNGHYKAESIHYRTTITGEISSTSSLQNSIDRVLTINGQLVYVAEDIEFESLNFDDLASGQTVSVSAFVKDDHLIATFIKLEDTSANPVVTGFVDEVDETDSTITVNDTTIGYAQSTLGETLNTLAPAQWLGQKVRIVLTNATDEFIASHISLSSQPTTQAGSKITIEGIINSTLSSNLFKVDDYEINLPDAVISTIDTNLIRENQRVSIQGRSNNLGAVEAESVRFIFSSPSRLEGRIDAINQSEGSISLLDNTIYFNPWTVYQDDGPSQQRRFNFEGLNIGDQLTVYAYQYNGQLYAKKVIREKNDMQPLRVRGEIEQINEDKSLQVLGYTILTNDMAYPIMISHLEVGKYIEVVGFLSAEKTITAQFLIPRKEPCNTPERPHCFDMLFPDNKDHGFFEFDKEAFDKEFPEGGLWPVDKSLDPEPDDGSESAAFDMSAKAL